MPLLPPPRRSVPGPLGAPPDAEGYQHAGALAKSDSSLRSYSKETKLFDIMGRIPAPTLDRAARGKATLLRPHGGRLFSQQALMPDHKRFLNTCPGEPLSSSPASCHAVFLDMSVGRHSMARQIRQRGHPIIVFDPRLADCFDLD